jgi:hypothetical protein
MTAPGEEEVDRSLGNCRWVAIGDTGYKPETEGGAWIRLHSLGLLNGAAQVGSGISHTFASGLALSVAVTPLGLQLHRWITSGLLS